MRSREIVDPIIAAPEESAMVVWASAAAAKTASNIKGMKTLHRAAAVACARGFAIFRLIETIPNFSGVNVLSGWFSWSFGALPKLFYTF